MKKLLLASLAVTNIVAFAYTQTDVDNATYLAGKGIITSQSTTAGYRLDDTITRAEVAGIALKLRGTTLPEGYACKRYFGDAIRNDWICRAVELAADAGFVSRTNRVFRPQDKITRAEALAIIFRASNLESNLPTNWEITQFEEYMKKGIMLVAKPIDWQYSLMKKALFFNIINEGSLEVGKNIENTKMMFFPGNVYASRAEVLSYAQKAHTTMATMSGEVTVQ